MLVMKRCLKKITQKWQQLQCDPKHVDERLDNLTRATLPLKDLAKAVLAIETPVMIRYVMNTI